MVATLSPGPERGIIQEVTFGGSASSPCARARFSNGDCDNRPTDNDSRFIPMKAVSEVCLGHQATGRYGLSQRLIVAFVLVGIGLCERSKRTIEALARAQIARDRDRVPRTRMRLARAWPQTPRTSS